MASRAHAYRPVEAAAADRRSDTRYRVTVSRATVRKPAEQPVTALLQDLSVYGCRLAAERSFDSGERVWLRLGGNMPIAGKIVWSEDGVIGCRFDEKIERSMMRSLTLALV